MQKQLLPEAEGYARSNIRRRIWRRLVRVMACIVVFCTTYALILPAITLEKSNVCGLEEHTHSDSCYTQLTSREILSLQCCRESLQIHQHTGECSNEEGALICGMADFVVHEHDSGCFDEAGTLVCTFPVIRAHTHEDGCFEPWHVHTEDCWIPAGEPVCGLEESEGHTHDESCGETVLICELTVEEHVHTDGCYEQLMCDLPEDENHTHDESCSGLVLVCQLTEQPHEHGEGCYETEYVCGLEATGGHVHDESCYREEAFLICQEEEADLALVEDVRGRLICEKEEITLHTHSDGCYEITEAEDGSEIWVLMCEKPEVSEHKHSESCYVTETVEADTQTLTCTDTTEGHEHTARCYGTWVLTCEMEEHTHTEECKVKSDLSEEEQAQVDEVIALIEPLPTYDEIVVKLDEFYEADDAEGEEAYLTEVYTQVEDAYRAYMALDESLREYVTNADKLMELEFIWSRVVFAPEINVSNGSISVPVTAVNAYDATNEVFKANVATILYGKTAAQLVSAGTFPSGADFKWHTAYILETLGTSDGNQYVVDAVIEGEFAKDTYKAKTTNGFVLYILNDYAKNIDISRGDLVDPDFWYGNHDGQINTDTGFGHLIFTDNNSADQTVNPATAVDINATVKILNYDDTINSQGLGVSGYNFYHGNYGYGPSIEHVNGVGNSNDGANGAQGAIKYPEMNQQLDTNGYPQMAEGSMAYLFDGSATRADGTSTLKGTMSNGGGLFQKDSEGYYYYDSLLNAAYYDSATNRFILSDNLIVRPWYNANNTTNEAYGNLLPFNRVTADNVTFDGALEDAGLTDDNAEYLYNKTASKTNMVANPDASTSRMARLEDQVDLWFGMTVEFEFFMPKGGLVNNEDMIFDFHGDDDVFVYIGVWNQESKAYDYQLVLDIGGTHGARSGAINFASGEVTDFPAGSEGTANTTARTRTLKEIFSLSGNTFADYSKLALKFFYMERGGNISYCRLRFNMPVLPNKSLTVTKELVIDETENEDVKEFLQETLMYKFRVMKADEEGNPTDELFVKPGMTYTILSGGAAVGTGTVSADGTFSLRPGQSAQFADMLVKGEGDINYVVQEIIPEDLIGQYGGIEYEVSGAGGSVESEEGKVEAFITYSTNNMSAESAQMVLFRNKVNTANLSILRITKALAPSASFDADKLFDIQVKLGGQLIPVGTQYQIDGTSEIGKVATPGIIQLKIGETAVILEGILSGTEYEITELGAENGGFTPSYSGTITHKDNSKTDVACTANGASGAFTLNSVVHVIVTNANYDFAFQIPIYKQALDNSDTAAFNFLMEQGIWEDGVWTQTADLPGTGITVNDAAQHSGTITIGYQAGTSGTFYYRITEQRGTGDYVYDTASYIVQVDVTGEGTDGHGTAEIVKIWRNGQEYTGNILFTNIKTTSLMVTKKVTGAISNDSFTFQATVVDKDGDPFTLPAPTDGRYTVSGNVATFQLVNGQSMSVDGIPYGAIVTVTETQHDGFVAYYQVSGVHDEQQLGDSISISFDKGMQTVTFINDGGYELPSTGGAGTYLYTMGGLLLMAAAILLYIHSSKRRKEARPSF